jgi:co-chaperonin GroES (HSP10)
VIRPLRDRIVVRALDVPLSSVIQVIEHGRDGKHHRGEVVAVGPSVKFDERYRPRTETDVQVGDVIHFTDIFRFPVVEVEGERLLILQEADVGGVEEREAA